MTRVFYAAERGPTHAPGIQSELWRKNLYGSLLRVADEVVELDYDLDQVSLAVLSGTVSAGQLRAEKERLREALRLQLRQARNAGRVDMFFSYFTARHCDQDTVREIRRDDTLAVNWFCNASYQFDLIAPLAPAYDFCLVPEKDRLDDYRRVGATPIYCPEAANPDVYRPLPEEQVYDVVFVGQRYGDRPAVIAYLRSRGIDVRVWGPGWAPSAEPGGRSGGAGLASLRRARSVLGRLRHMDGWHLLAEKALDRVRYRLPPGVAGGPLTDAELVRTYSRARVVLGLSAVGETHRTGKRVLQVRLRDVEALMSGAFYLTEYQEDLAEMFEADREVVFYRSREELADKLEFYLRRPELRESIRRRGRERALADHTWEQRFAMVFETVGLPLKRPARRNP